MGLLPAPGARKAAILALTPVCARGAEIGADHGITSAHLLQSGRCGTMIVSDISAASLDKARRPFALHGLEGRAVFRVADGLRALDGPVGAVVIAGMGAQRIAQILSGCTPALAGAAFILQPIPDPPFLRRWLMENGFRLEAERLAREGRRYYIVLRAARGRAAYTPKELLLGPLLLRERPPLWREYLCWRRNCLLAGREAGDAVGWIKEELDALDGTDGV